MRLHTKLAATALLAAAVLLFLAGSAPLAAADDDGRVHLEFKLTGKGTGKPINGASIYVKFKQKRRLRRDQRREWTVKTNPKGLAAITGLPEGTVLVQIVIPGWRTYGKFHEIKGPKQVLDIVLEKPPKWF